MPVGNYGAATQSGQKPSCWGTIKMGFGMGFFVGMSAGVIFGTYGGLRMGLRGKELLGAMGKTMVQSGGTFGTFMAIGMGLRGCL